MVLALTILAFTSLGGCEKKDPKAQAEAIPLTREAVSAEDGMILLDHPGPKGQLLLSDGTREYYCDIPGMFRSLQSPSAQNRIVQAFSQPFDQREWGSFKDGWSKAESLIYVVGSNRMGAMGPTFVPFQDESSAHAFVEKQGGRAVKFEEITAEFLEAHQREVREQMRAQGAGSMSGHQKAGEMSHGHSMTPMDKKNESPSEPAMDHSEGMKKPMKH